MMDYKEKIHKLLALAESPNEHEARAALLKARELMAEHKLSASECEDFTAKEVVRKLSGLTCTKSSSGWMPQLASVIADNYCCRAYMRHARKSKTYEIGFVGFECDIGICVEVFSYAVDCVQSWVRYFRQEAKKRGVAAAAARNACNAYGEGFAEGIKQAYAGQDDDESGWGLVMQTPQEVIDNMSDMTRSVTFPEADADAAGARRAYAGGYGDGSEFDPSRRIAANA